MAETTHHYDQEVGAAFIASGVGALGFGLLVVLSEASAAIKTALTLFKPVGALSGKSIVGSAIFLIAWLILHYTVGKSSLKLNTAFTIAIVLIGLGLLLTFPPIFLLFES